MQASPSLLALTHPSQLWPVARSSPWKWARPRPSAKLFGRPLELGSSEWANPTAVFQNCSNKLFEMEKKMIVRLFNREETEIIEGEVVEIQIDRPATGTVGSPVSYKYTHIFHYVSSGWPVTEYTICLSTHSVTIKDKLTRNLLCLSGCQGGKADSEDYWDGDDIWSGQQDDWQSQ